MAEVWLETDECEDVLSSVRHCSVSFGLAETDLHAFKWVILSLHSALQGSCVCHLVGTAGPLGATTKRNATEWCVYYAAKVDEQVSRPKTKIAELPELLKRIRKENSAGDGSQGSEIQLTDSDLQWWKRTHDRMRNQFVHFEPMGWSIELSGIPELVLVTSRIIKEIESNGWAFRHMSDEWRCTLCEEIRNLETRARDWVFKG
ncbi:MAG: hypothetical protein ABL914_11305 [Novosphingobium sp.]|uniref:hypothetical protein n=1 Tax=Novosphingobium sp. TaxID=1874826 RepID=UPI0032BB5C08